MFLYRFGFFCCLMIVLGCRTVTVQNKHYQTTTKQVVLGTLGMDKTYDFEKSYTYSGVPDYTVPIKVQVTPIAFNKSKFKVFQRARALQSSNVNLNFIDSIPDQSQFLDIEIFDKIGLINLLNSPENKSVKTYLQNQDQSHIVTNMSIALNEKEMDDMINAQAVFIESIGNKTLGLNLYVNGTLTRTIGFNEGVVFAYRTASVCWKEKGYQLEIVDLVEGNKGCPKSSRRLAKKAKKKINYYKF